MKKTKLSLVVAGLVFAAGVIFTGCPKATDDNGDKTLKATDLIKFNLADAQALGTVFGSTDSSEQLLKFAADGTASNVIEAVTVPRSARAGDDSNEPLEIDLSTLEKILEVKKNPYSTIMAAAKGSYVVFKERNQNLKYTDGFAAPMLGQLIYSTPNGSIVDVSGEGMIIPKDDRDYIEFANSGKAFFLMWVEDKVSGDWYEKVMCFDPSKKSTTTIYANNSKFEIGDFRINENGSWMFVIAYDKSNTNIQKGILHIYAIPTANPSAKQELFTLPEGIEAGADKIGYDPASKYMFVKIYDDDMLLGQRVYKWNNGYSAINGYNARRLHEYVIPTWYNKYKDELNMAEDEVFEKIATNIKNICDLAHNDYNGDGTGSSNDIEINLSFFKDNAEYSNLYNADAKDGEAIKILFNNLYPNGASGEKDTNSQFYKFLKTYGEFNGLDHMLIYPLDKLCFLKSSNGNSTTTAAKEIDEELYGLEFTDLVTTNYGSWCVGPMGGWDESVPEFAYLNQLSDNTGKILMTIPESMQNKDDPDHWIDFNNWGGYWGWTPEEAGATDNNPIIYHFPFSASEVGVALVALGRKDIIYVDAETTQARKLLTTKDMSNIDFIFTISCENDMVYYTAKTKSGEWVNEGIRLADGSLYTLKETGLLSSIIGM